MVEKHRALQEDSTSISPLLYLHPQEEEVTSGGTISLLPSQQSS